MNEPTLRRTRTDVRILEVNDNPRDMELEWITLVRLGYSKPALSRDGVEAMNYLGEEGKIDLVLMDTQMPRVDGLEACRDIRLKPYGQRIAIIGTSDNPDREKEWYNSGADYFFLRNDMLANPSKLDATIQEALRRRQNLELTL